MDNIRQHYNVKSKTADPVLWDSCGFSSFYDIHKVKQDFSLLLGKGAPL